MDRSRIALVVILLLLITGGLILYYDRQNNGQLFTNTTTPQVGIGGGPGSPSVTPQVQVYTGDIVSVSTIPLQYKNATLVTIYENDVPLNLYVTSDTSVYTADNKLVPRSYLREGMTIQAQGMPVEGGIDVTTVRIQQGTSTTDEKELESTISPTQKIEVVTPTVTNTPTNTSIPTASPVPSL